MTLEENLQLAFRLIPKELLNTLLMVAGSTFFSLLIGFFLGVFLVLTGKGGLKEKRAFYNTLGILVNVGRSIPFAILMIALIPFTRFVVGTSIGSFAAIVPLSIAGAPFFARFVEASLKQVDSGVIEAAIVMNANTSMIVKKVLFPEALPLLIKGATLTVVSLIGYSAMAGLVGGGGLGAIAIQYGYQRFNGFLMIVTLVLLLLLVEIVQWVGNGLANSLSKKRGTR